MEVGDPVALLDGMLPPDIRDELEERLWRPIERQATLEVIRDDPAFLADPGRHPAIFADHGVVHVRDVALGLVKLLDTTDGVTLPGRDVERRMFVATIGVALTYLHDVGMVDMTRVGRRTHPVYAAHLAFSPAVDGLVGHLLASDPVRARLDEVGTGDASGVPVAIVVREILSLCLAHSKTSVPAAVLDDRPAFRRLMQRSVFTGLDVHRALDRPITADDPFPTSNAVNTEHYADPLDAFGWLDAEAGPGARLADDVIDAVRLLRAADVLRQRGTVLRTSAGYEVCMDADTARAVCTLRTALGDAAYVISYDDERGAGEANIRVAFVTPRGDLRIAVHRGRFPTVAATERAARSVATIVHDIALDVIPSFSGRSVGDGLRPPRRAADDLRIEIERPADAPGFADAVVALVADREPSLAHRLVAVADVESAESAERRRYHQAETIDPVGSTADLVIREVAARGVDTDGLDPARAFAEARRADVEAGEALVTRGSPAAFVYIPTGPGLVVTPDGGYAPSPLQPWVPVGTTGVIRRAERNSGIVAEGAVAVIMIPAASYVEAWLRPLDVRDLAARVASMTPA